MSDDLDSGVYTVDGLLRVRILNSCKAHCLPYLNYLISILSQILKERDDEIRDLTNQVESNKRGGRGGSEKENELVDEIIELERELEEVTRHRDDALNRASDLEERIAETNSLIKKNTTAKGDADDQISKLKRDNDQLNTAFLDLSKKLAEAEKTTMGARRMKDESRKEQNKYLTEIENLQKEVCMFY